MVTLTLHLDDNTYQNIENDAKQNNMKISDYVISLIQSKKTLVQEPTYPQLDELIGKYGQCAKNTNPVSIEDMNKAIEDAVKREWQG